MTINYPYPLGVSIATNWDWDWHMFQLNVVNALEGGAIKEVDLKKCGQKQCSFSQGYQKIHWKWKSIIEDEH